MSDPKPDNPLHGKPPAPDDVRDPAPKGRNPNASFHVENDPEWKKRPGQYPVAKKGLQGQGGRGKG